MMWECGCGVVNRDSRVKCRACRTPEGMVWTPTERDVSRSGLLGALGVGCVILFVGAAISIPGMITAPTRAKHARAAGDAKTAVTQAIVYAKDNGVYPTSIAVLREEGYANIPDKDPWGNDWVLSQVLTQGSEPKEGDNVYVFSRGPKGTGVYPEPFTTEISKGDSVGYSSVNGLWVYR